MVLINRIYTKTGDKGRTSFGDGTRVPKHHPRVEAYGAVDEANAAIGLARIEAYGEEAAMLERIQNDLFDVGGDLCTPEESRRSEGALRVLASQVERLEREIDAMNAGLSPLRSFVLPGGTILATRLHVARTIVRRAERRVCELMETAEVNREALRYLNRLSDHLFVMARVANGRGELDALWIPGRNR